MPLPAQLPRGTPDFTGRAGVIAELHAAARAGPAGHPVPVIVVSGIPGVGKTALAVQFAHQVAARFPDGQLYVTLHGFGPAQPVTPSTAVCGFLEALGVPATGVRAVFSWSYRQLDPAAARLFRLLGLHPGPDITVAAAASLAGCPVRQALAALAGLHLIAEHARGRYACHDLLRDFAAELTLTLDREADRHAATGRILDHYLRTAHAAAMLLSLEPIHGPITLPALSPGAEPEPLADEAAALTWFSAQRPVLLAAVGHAAATGWKVHAWQLGWALRDYLARRGYLHDLLATQRTALAACQDLGDRHGEARARSGLASACEWLGRHDEASSHLRRALELFAELGEPANQAMIYLDLGWVLSNQGELAAALDHAERALALYRAVGDHNGEAMCLNNIGWAHVQLGDHRQALAYCLQAVALNQEQGDRQGIYRDCPQIYLRKSQAAPVVRTPGCGLLPSDWLHPKEEAACDSETRT